ncbi:MAG: hypothetical protein AB1758_07355 [Candidatus Eremiobacterota bacterium]
MGLPERVHWDIPGTLAWAPTRPGKWAWLQNLNDQHWTRAEVEQRLEEKMRLATRDVIAMSRQHKVDLRTGAFLLGVSRVSEAIHTRLANTWYVAR